MNDRAIAVSGRLLRLCEAVEEMTRAVWIPEYPDTPATTVYAAPEGFATTPGEALHFATEQECQGWCDTHDVYALPWRPVRYRISKLKTGTIATKADA